MPNTGPPYKDVMGRWRTQNLFKENYVSDSYPPVFTLKEDDDVDKDGNVLPSLRRLFLQYRDPTGYALAKEVLGSWDHWKKLSRCSWFIPHLEEWTEELETLIISEAINKARVVSNGESNSAFAAAKYLAEKGWVPKRGRPTKAEIEHERKKAAGLQDDVQDDLERIRVVK